jgi:glycerophosphoryl diester phosphodiesterase
MAFPDGVPTVLVRYSGTNPAGGGPATGTVKLQPNVPAITLEGVGRVFAGSGTYRFADGVLVDADGNPGVPILPNDAPGTNPSGWLWLAVEKIDGAPQRLYYFRVSVDQEEVDLAEVQQLDPGRPDYVTVVGPAGRDGRDGIDGTDGESAYQIALANGFEGTLDAWLASLVGPPGSQANAQAYTDTAMAAEVERADAAYAAGDDARLTDARVPLSHAASHGSAGGDPITPAAIGAYSASAGTALAGRVTGVETRATALESGKADLVGGVVPTAQLPALAIGDTFPVASQAAMLALTAQRGDMAIRSDTTPARTYVLAADDPTVLGNWLRVSFGDIASINGQTGVVVLAAADVGAETPAGATTKANSAQSAAITAAAADATTKAAGAQSAAIAAAAADAASKYAPQTIATVAAAVTPNPFYVAHRGSGSEFPEHTMVAYSAAVAAGAPGIEVSAHVTADGVVFCMHDTTLDRVTNGTWTGSNATWTWAALNQRAKIVGTPLLGPGWSDQPIPTLREVLDRFLGHTVIWLEAKSSASVVPIQTMLTTLYPYANQCVVWKNYYTNNSLAWAKSHGFKVWAYTDTNTTSAQMDAVDATVDYWGVPWEASDAQISLVVARGKPVMVWEVHRRSEVPRLTALGVRGIMCSEYLYVTHSTSTPMVTTNTFTSQVKAPGDIGAAHSDPTYAMKWDTAVDPGAVYLNQLGGQGLLLGSRSCMTDGATGYRITFDMYWPTLPGSPGTLHAGLYFGAADDSKHQFGVANTAGCYRMLIRPNAGTLQLYTVAAGATSGVQVGGSGTGDLATSAMSAATWYSFQIDVTTTSITLRRTDSTGWSKTFADTTYRGRYFGLQNGSLTDLATVPRYRILLPTPI